MGEKELGKIFTFGGIIFLAIGTSYMIRAYLDLLRIKKIKQEMNNGQIGSSSVMNQD